MKTSFLIGLSLAASAAVALAIAGCGSGKGTAPANIFASATPAPISVVPTPAPTPFSGVPEVASRAGDFNFKKNELFLNYKDGTDFFYANVPLNSSGSGTTPVVLQSVNGFKAPIALSTTISITTADEATTLDPGLARASLSSATLPNLAPGNTTVTLGVQTTGTLPPLARIKVNLSAEGGGLKRYPQGIGGGVGNYDSFVFITPGLRFTNYLFPSGFRPTPGGPETPNPFNGLAGSSKTAQAFFETYGLTGTATFGATGLPSGVSVSFEKPTLAINPAPATDQYGLFVPPPQNMPTFTATQDVAPGTYPVRLTATINGVTYSSDPQDLVVTGVSKPSFNPPGSPEPPFVNFDNASGSTLTGHTVILASESTGTATLGITGLPSGVTAAFTRPTVTLPVSASDSNVDFTLTANQDITPGTYLVRVTITINGFTYPSSPFKLVVIEASGN